MTIWSARCQRSNGYSTALATFRVLFDSYCRSFASKLEQIVNLLCAWVNSASYPQWNGNE